MLVCPLHHELIDSHEYVADWQQPDIANGFTLGSSKKGRARG